MELPPQRSAHRVHRDSKYYEFVDLVLVVLAGVFPPNLHFRAHHTTTPSLSLGVSLVSFARERPIFCCPTSWCNTDQRPTMPTLAHSLWCALLHSPAAWPTDPNDQLTMSPHTLVNRNIHTFRNPPVIRTITRHAPTLCCFSKGDCGRTTTWRKHR